MSISHVTKVENVFFPQGVYIWADLEMGGALKLREGVGPLGGKTWLVLSQWGSRNWSWSCGTASQPPGSTLLAVISPVSMIWIKWVWCSAQCPCHGSPGGPHLQSSDPDAMVHLQIILPKSRQRKCFMLELRYAKYDHLVFCLWTWFLYEPPPWFEW